MTGRSIESLPGFLGWFDEGQAPPEAFTISTWGVRLTAAFDRELTGEALSDALELLGQLPQDCDPIDEMIIEVFTYHKVKVDVEGLHLRSPEVTQAAYELLDPDAHIGLSGVMVSRVWRVFASPGAAAELASKLAPLGLSSETEECEDYLTPGGIIIEDPQVLLREVERRRARGRALHRIGFPERLRSSLEGYEL